MSDFTYLNTDTDYNFLENFSKILESKEENLRQNAMLLVELCKKGLENRYGIDCDNLDDFSDFEFAKIACKRLEHELSIIISLDFAEYFLMTQDYVNWAKNHYIMVGEGRGASGGCFVAYVLNITNIDPLKFNLKFERFLNFKKAFKPDFYIDLPHDKKDLVIDYISNKYGKSRVLKIVDFEKLSPTMPDKNASAIIISDKELSSEAVLPAENSKGKFSITELEDLGFSIIYLFGNEELSFISALQNNIRENNPSFDIEKISLRDKKTFELLRSGDTQGIFELESEKAQDFCKKIEIDSIDEISAYIALNTSKTNDLREEYMANKKQPSNAKIDNPLLKDLLKENYGILIYQEDIIDIAHKIGAYSLEEADILRRNMGKKNLVLIEEQKAIFIEKATQTKNLSKEDSAEIFDTMWKSAEYTFNKSHSLAHALLSYKLAYLKANYPCEFKGKTS